MTKTIFYFLFLVSFISYGQAPVANDDANRTARNTTLNVPADGVLSNDSDPNGLSLSVVSYEVGGSTYAVGATTSITGGDITLNADGSFTFVPNGGFQGNAAVVTYTISNGTQTDTANLRISVNYRPRARNNYNVTTENVTLNVGVPGVLDNDTDHDGDPLTVIRFVISGTSYNVGQTAHLAEGDLRINADGSYRFSPAWGYTGSVPRARYYITDGYNEHSAYLYLRVNTPPVANDDTEVATENTTLTGNVMDNDSDPDGNAIHVQSYTVNGTSYTAGVTAHLAEGDITINSNGSYTFVPANGYTGGVPTITYTISDWVETDTADLNIRVNNPPVTNDEHEVTTENTTLNGNVLGNDSDADGDALTIANFTVGNNTYAPGTTVHLSQGDITVNADGSYTFVPTHNYTGFVPDITYSVTDGYENTTALLDIIVDFVDITPTVRVQSCNQGYTASGLYKIRYNFRIRNRSYAYGATNLQVIDDLINVFGGTPGNHCIVEIERNWIGTSDPLGGQPRMWTTTSWDVNEFDENDPTPGRQGIFNSAAVNNNELYPRQAIYGQFCVYVDPNCAGGVGVGATNGVVFDNIMEVNSSLGNSNGHIRITDFHTTQTTVAGGIYIPNSHPPTNGDGTYDFDIVVTITNDGGATANNVQFFLPLYRLVTNGVPINTSVVTQVSGAPVTVNAAYDGGDTSGNNTDMLAAGVSMASGSTIVLNAHFNVGPTAYTGWARFDAPNPSMTQGPADAFPASHVEDPGRDSYVIWDDAQGGHLDRYYFLRHAGDNPSSEMQCNCDLGSINFNYGIQLHVNKTIVSNVQHPGNESGNRDITFQITVENDNASDVRLENLSLTDDLAAICGPSKVVAVQLPTIVSSTATTNPIINAGYNGVSDIDIFDNTSGILEHGESITVQIQVEMDDPCFGVNDVYFKGTDPAGNDVNTVNSGVEVEVYPDFDNDLLTDNIDIDDDNDAILDTDEACTGLNGYYWGASASIDNILDAVRNSNTALSPNATFIVTSTDFDNGGGGLGNGTNLQDLLDADASSLDTDPGNTPRAVIKMYGYVYLEAGTHNFRVRADDGYRIRVNNNEVAIRDTNQPLTTTVHPNFTIGTNGWYPIEILYWDAGGSWGLFIEEQLQGNGYHFLDATNTLRDCDFDRDGNDNHVDLDSDNDGISDITEAQGTDADFDAQVDYTTPGNPRTMTDADNDGLADVYDINQGGTAIPNPDTDGDGHHNFIDIDSDGDGIVDYIEAQLSNSLIHPFQNDADGDGLDDAYDADDFQTFGIGAGTGTNIVPVNTDGIDTPDYIDTNSDDDFDSDALEGWDLNNDLIPDTVPSGNDNDEDGLDDAYDNLPTQPDPTNNNQTAMSFPDIDTPGGDRDWREKYPNIEVLKDDNLTYTPQNLVVGDVINYSITVVNSGNVPLTNITVTDLNATVSGSPVATVAPYSSTVITATHTVSQADIDAGQVINTASVSTDFEGQTYTDVSDDTGDTGPDNGDDDPTITLIQKDPELTVTKDDQLSYSPQALAVGDVITYQIVVTNSGNVTLTDIDVTDGNAQLQGTTHINTLSSGQSITFTATHTVTQVEINNGSISNTATVTTHYDGATIIDHSDDLDPSSPSGDNDPTITFIIQSPSIEVTKDDQLPYTDQNMVVGDVITYTVQVTNTGNVDLNTVNITDANAVIVSGNPISNLAPGTTQSVTVSHTVTQADLDQGFVSNSAIATTTFNGTDYTDISDDTDLASPPGNNDPTLTNLVQNPSFYVLKDDGLAYLDQNLSVGDVITYSISVVNNGNVTLTNVVVTDANATFAGSNVINTLTVGQNTTITATHTVTQADMDAGVIINSATGTTTFDGVTITDDSDDTDPGSPAGSDDATETHINQLPEITIIKDDQLPYTAQNLTVGSIITYEIIVTNTGNVTLDNINVSDANATLAVGGSPIATLAPGTSVTINASHTVTQAEITAGQVSNSAIASVTYQGDTYTDISDDTDVSSPLGDDDSTITFILQTPGLTVTKDDQLPYSPQTLSIGDVINYNIYVTNSGNVDLTNITVTDVNATISGNNVIANLIVNQTITLTATHIVSQADIDAGQILNSAIATVDFNGATYTDISDDTDPSSAGGADDDTITFVIQSPSLVITKNDQLPYTVQNMSVGDVITYEILVTNTGNVTLPTVTVSDANANIVSGNPAINLAPGAIQTIVATHTITQADINAGQVTNSATVNTDFNGTTYTDVSDDTDVDSPPADDDATITHLWQNPSLEVLKDDGLPYSPQNLSVGDVITYTMYVHNTGNVDLTNIGVTDVNATIQGTNIIPNLAVNQTVTLTAAHTVTQADIDAGEIQNSAVATLTYNGTSISDTSDDTDPSSPIGTDDPTVTFIMQSGDLTVTKDDQLAYTPQNLAVGDVITYQITVNNSGNVNLSNITVTDANAIVTGSPIATLAPGSLVTLTATHTVTQADINAGQVSNSVIASVTHNGINYSDISDDTDPSSPSGNDDATITFIMQSPELTVTKDDQLSYSPQNLSIGDVITYNISITNTGNVDLSNVSVHDINATISGSNVINSLPVGQTESLTATHLVTQSDVDAGQISNSATASVIYQSVTYSDISDDTDPSSPIGNDDNTITFIIQSPDLVITKNDQLPYTDQNMSVGDVITYEVLVTNTGNVTLPTVTVSDANANIVSGNPATNLAPGATQTIMATHTITQADLNAGQVSNSATASADYNGQTYADVSDDTDVASPAGDNDATITHLLQNPIIEVMKDDGLAYTPQNLSVGDVITYTITVRNTGNVDISNIGVTDVNAIIQGINIIPSLTVNQSETLTAVHTVTQADIDAGEVQNSAEGTFTFNSISISDVSDDTDPSSPTGNDDPTITHIVQRGEMVVTKDDNLPMVAQNLSVGDVISYQITVTNTGNTRLYNIDVTDANATITSGSPIALLEVGASATVTATHMVTQAEINTGQVSNTAVASSLLNGSVVSDQSDDTDPNSPAGEDDPTITLLTQSPGLTVTKDDQLAYTAQNLSVGDIITYQILVENTGNVIINNITITDANAIISGSNVINTLAPGQVETLTATHAVTQVDIDAGQVANSAVASAIYHSATVTDTSDDTDLSSPNGDDDPTITFITQSPDLVITKNDQLPLTPQNMNVSDVITYEILVTNTGNVTLPVITVSDANATVVSGNPIVNLAPGATHTVVVTHTITQADLDVGKVVNSAVATVEFNGQAYSDISDDTDIDSPVGTDDPTVTLLSQNPSFYVLKDDGYNYVPQNLAVGDVITYNINVVNDGNVTLSNVLITDANANFTGSNTIPSIAVGQTVTVIATHTITQGDVDTGQVSNSATGTTTYNNVSISDLSDDTDAASPGGDDDPTITFIQLSPELTVIKDDQLDYTNQNMLIGTIITYQIVVTNTGNVTLDNINVTDPNATLSATAIAVLAPGDSQTISATHILTQADVNAGQVVNQATATTDYNGLAVTDLSDDTDPASPIGPNDPTITHIRQFPELTVTKDDQLSYIPQNLTVGDVITYQIVIQNTGNVQLDQVVVADGNAILSGTGIIPTLNPNQIITMIATHTVTQSDINAGQIVNQATASVNYNGLAVSDLSDDTDLSSPTGDNDSTITSIIQTPGLVLTKDDQLSYVPHNMNVGDIITYNILVTNTGNVTMPLVSISDNNANIISGNPIVNLAPGVTHAIVAQHIITQADIDAGQVSNSAIASADFNGQNYSDVSDDTDIDSPAGDDDPTITRFVRNPGFYMTKDDGLPYIPQNLAVGDIITYNINLVNSGNVTLNDLIITDNNATFAGSNVVAVLDVGQTITVTATHIITQADIDNGLVINSASATTRFNFNDITDISDDIDPASPAGDDDPTVTHISQSPEITVTKDDQLPYTPQSLAVGYIINYQIEVTNSGNVTLDNVDVTDNNATIVSGLPIITLLPGQTVTINATHTVTQADIDSGEVVNSANASTTYHNNPLNDISDDTDPASPVGNDDATITHISRNPKLTVTKDDGLGYAPQNISVGDVISYQIVVQNSGNVVLNSITVTDANATISGTGIISSLAPGQVETLTASHVVTQAEVDAGEIINTAIASVLYNGVTVSDLSDDADLASPTGDDDPTITHIIQNPDLVITKNDQLPYIPQNMNVGDVITYEILVSNTGNVTLPLISISDPNANIISGSPITNIPSGITRTVIATHTVTQIDLDAGLIVNSATVSADFNGQTYSDISDDTDVDSPAGDNDPTITRLVQNPSYYITKDDGFPFVAQNLAVGDVVTYTINIVNNGNVTLTDILIVDNNANFTSGNTIATLLVSQTETLTATHVVTQADIDNGFIANTATGRTRFNYQEYTDISDDTDAAAGPSDSDATITLITQDPELTVTKDDQLPYDPQSLVVGDVIVYNIMVINSGNVTLNNISVSDANAVITNGTPIASLAPGHSDIITATHTVTQADIDAAEVSNVAIATVDYQGNAVTDISDDTDSLSPGGPDDATITHIAQDPVLEVTKDDQLAYVPQNIVVGDIINYVIVVKNNGNVILNNVVVSDANATITGSHIIATLAPNQVATLNATHIVTQAEINAGQIVNTAVATVLYNGVPVSDLSDDADLSSPTGVDDPTITFIAQQPSIVLTKNDNLPYIPQNMNVGDVITYEILVTNTGNVTLPVVTVTDNNANIVSGNPIIDLAPHITRTVVATHTITQADIDLGYVSNSATASSDFNGQTYSDISDDTDSNSPMGDDDATITYLNQHPIFVIMKDDGLAYSAQNMAVGDIITYNIYVENIGNVTLTNINIDDDNANIVGSDLIPILNVGQTVTLTATHTITQADIDAGEIINSATGESTFGNDTITDISDDTDPNAPAGNDDPTVTSLLQNPSFTIMKDDQLPYVAQTLSVGDVITYQLTVNNTGNTTLTNIDIIDANAIILSGNPIASLAPSDHEVLTATHIVTQADIDAGEIVNSATGSTTVNGISVTDISDDTDPASPAGNADPTVTHIVKNVEITVTKDDQMSYSPQALSVGDVITYQIIVQNTGNVTLHNINVTDNNANIVGSHNIVSLDPGQIVILQAVHTVTQDDINLGQISNSATVSVQYNGTTISDLSDDTDLYSPAGDDDPTITHLIQVPGVTVTKDDQLPYTVQNLEVGDDITYLIVVTNTGNVTLPLINISDNNANIISGNPIVNLQPSISANIAAVHTVTQADLDAGQIVNSATASFTYNGQPYTDDSDDTDIDSPSGDDDPTITHITQNPSIVVTKDDGLSYLPQNLVVGDVITYNIVIKNNGNVTLNNIQVTDNNATLQGNTLINQLDVNQTATYIATYSVTQADIDVGFVSNTAHAETTYNNNIVADDSDDLDPDSPAGNDDATITHIIQNPVITITKDDHLAYTNQNVAVGDVINYDIVVTNTGNTTLTNIQVTDNNANIITGNPIATLVPGASATITATHDVTQADIDAGLISNSAVGQTSFNGNNVSDISDDTDPMSPGGSDDPTITHITQITGMYVTKDDQLDYTPQNLSTGDIINYLIIVHNTGNVTLHNILVTDNNANIVGVNTITSIAPGDLHVLNATHIITQDDMNNGIVINSATAETSFNGVGMTDISDDTDPASPAGDNDATETHIIRTPAVTLMKDDQLPFAAQNLAVGDIVTYNIVVTNTGNVTLNYTEVTDNNANIISGSPVIDLQPNLSATVVATHTITQADLDAGLVINSATAETSFNGTDYTDISDDTDPDSALGDNDPTITNLVQNIEITITKDDALPYTEQSLSVGDIVNYEIRITNTGNVTITHDITVTDVNANFISNNVIVGGLTVNQSVVMQATHTVTQADIDRGYVLNQAEGSFVHGSQTITDLSDDNDTASPPGNDDPTMTYIKRTVSFEVTKDDQLTYLPQALSVGDVINYNIVVTNLGNVTLSNINVDDPNALILSGNPVATLDPSVSTTITAIHTITQADLDLGYVSNSATATTVFDGTTYTDTSDDTDPDSPLGNDDPTITHILKHSALGLIKVGVIETMHPICPMPGERIIYTFEVHNNGNQNIANVHVVDPMLTNPIIYVSGDLDGDNKLGQHEVWIYTSSYELTQAIVDAGFIDNQAIVHGIDPNGVGVSDISDDPNDLTNRDLNLDGDPDDPTHTVIPQHADLTLLKEGTFNDENGNGLADEGETISYKFTVKNRCNVTLQNIRVSDPLIQVTPVSIVLEAQGVNTNTFTGVYTITIDDIERGYVTNQATVEGYDPAGNLISDLSDDPNNATDIDPDGDGEPDDPTVVATPNIKIYEILTPNDDGINEHFVIVGIENFPRNMVKIYNRWGSLVFQTSTYNNTDNYWEGLNKDKKKLPVGVYYYVIDLGIKDVENIFTGSVFLNR